MADKVLTWRDLGLMIGGRHGYEARPIDYDGDVILSRDELNLPAGTELRFSRIHTGGKFIVDGNIKLVVGELEASSVHTEGAIEVLRRVSCHGAFEAKSAKVGSITAESISVDGVLEAKDSVIAEKSITAHTIEGPEMLITLKGGITAQKVQCNAIGSGMVADKPVISHIEALEARHYIKFQNAPRESELKETARAEPKKAVPA